MPDVRIDLGIAGSRTGAHLELAVDGVAERPEPAFLENLSAFTLGPYAVVDGVPQADGAGVRQATVAGVDSRAAVLTPIDPVTMFGDAYAHWVPRAQDFVAAGALYRWWPVSGPRTDDDPRMSLFKINPDPASSGALQYALPGSPHLEAAYSYQGFGRALSRPALVFDDGQGYCKIDPEGNFASATLEVTAVYHPSQQPYYGLFEAATEVDATSETQIGDALVLRWHHGQLRLYYGNQLVLSHESHRRSAAPMTMLISLDAATDVGRFYCLDENRTTRTFNTAGMSYVALLGAFGALGQGRVGNRYRYAAEMDVLDVCLWDYAMDWPELEQKANLCSLAYGVGV